MATIVDGVRQKPSYQTTGFAVDTEAYLYNVGAGQFFTQGNNWATQASIGDEPRLVSFASNSASDYTLECYCWRNSDQQGGYMAAGWRNVFFDSETALFVDRGSQSNYYFSVENNGGTFRIYTSINNPTFGDYAGAGLYVGLLKNSNSTVLSPFVDEDEAYVDWALVSEADYDALASDVAIYNKAQELKVWIDKIVAENGDASALSTVYLNEDATLAELQEAIDDAQPLFIKALINNAPDKNNVDVTLALINPDFENGETGWTVTATAGSGANGRAGNVRPGGSSSNQCYEAWNNSAFDIYQTIPEMPVGVYEIEVQGFYRYGRGDVAWNAYLSQNVDYVKPEGVPVYVYLNNNATNFVNVFGDEKQITTESFYSSGSTDYSSQAKNGTTYYFPNGMASAAIAFSDGMYKQSAYGLIANEGDNFRIGVKGNSSQLGDSWVIWDNFKLYYRGFKAEVVQPILETAMADLNQYATLLMGKTEYATLSKAMTDAQTAIENQDGEAMFAALNDLYNVKEAVIASKDLFLEQEVATDLTNLQAAIAEVAEEKLSAATRNAATILSTGIAGNTLYEGTEIVQLKNDVSNAITSLSNSVNLYSQLNTAITSLAAATEKKANQALQDEAATLLATAKTGYDEGSIADSEVSTQITDLNAKVTAINTSAEAYATLTAAITRLENAIAEASAEEARVAKSTLTKANLRLTASRKLYDEGTIADADIPTRVETIDQLITELTHSIELYRQFNEGLSALQEALATEEKLSAATRNTAQDVYDTALEAYNAGDVDDDQIAAQVISLQAQVTAINNSIEKYADLAEAYPALEDVINLKAQQTLVDEANSLYTTASEGYVQGTIADDDIEGMITDIEAIIPEVQASAEKYTELATAIEDLEAAIAEASADEAHVAKSTLTKANLRLTASKNLYDNGTIADTDIDARVETINQLITELTYSIRLYQEFKTSLESLATALSTEEKLSAATRSTAQSVYDTALEAYNAGTVDDDQIEAQKNALNVQIEAIDNSISKYAELDEAIAALKTELDKEAPVEAAVRTAAETAYSDAVAAYNDGTVADANVATEISSLNAQVANLQNSAAKYIELATAINSLNAAIEHNPSLPAAMQENASALQTAAQSGYNNGSFAGDEIAAEVTALSAAAANIAAANGIEANATARTTELAQLRTSFAEATEQVAQAKTDIATAYIESAQKAEIEAQLTTFDSELQDINPEAIAATISSAESALSTATSDLTVDHAAALTTAANDMTSLETTISDAQETLDAMLDYLAVEPSQAIAASSNVVELTAEYGTFCSALDLDFSEVEGLKAYIVSAYYPEEGKVVLTRVTDVPAGTGLVVVGTPGGRYEIPSGTGSTLLSNLLVGVTRSRELEASEGGKVNCILSDGSFGIGFYPTTGGILAAGRAYLPLPSEALEQQAGVGAFTLVFEDATRIGSIGDAAAGDIWYGMDGQMHQKKPATKGVYIRGGRKVLVRKE